jgi:hypothetical protein
MKKQAFVNEAILVASVASPCLVKVSIDGVDLGVSLVRVLQHPCHAVRLALELIVDNVARVPDLYIDDKLGNQITKH